METLKLLFDFICGYNQRLPRKSEETLDTETVLRRKDNGDFRRWIKYTLLYDMITGLQDEEVEPGENEPYRLRYLNT